MKETLLEVIDLDKSYGDSKILKNLTFTIRQGDIVGYLGANGAGKSTSIRLIAGIENDCDGTIKYENNSIAKLNKEYQKNIGVVPQELAIYQDMSGYDNVKFFCSLYGFDKKEVLRRTKEALEFVDLWDKRKEKAKNYSGGMKRRLNIACAIAHSPKFLIMDEPTVGIDPQSRNHIMETIRELNKRGTTVLYVSHYMEEIEALCNRILLIEAGTIIRDSEKDELKKEYEKMGCHSLEDIFLTITGKQLRDEVKK